MGYSRSLIQLHLYEKEEKEVKQGQSRGWREAKNYQLLPELGRNKGRPSIRAFAEGKALLT